MTVVSYIILADFDEWQIKVIGKQGELPVRPIHTIRYVAAYLRCGNGSFIHRVSSVLKRSFTKTLKPSQVESSKQKESTEEGKITKENA